MNGLAKMLGTEADKSWKPTGKKQPTPVRCPPDLCTRHGIAQTNELKGF